MRQSIINTTAHLAQDVIWSARKRPLAPWAVMLAIGTFVGIECDLAADTWPCTVALGLAVLVIGSLRRVLQERWWGDGLLISVFALFILSVGFLRGSDSKTGFITHGGKCDIEGEVTHITKRDTNRISAVIRAESINGHDVHEIKGLVNFRERDGKFPISESYGGTKPLKCGMKVRVSGLFSAPRADRFGYFDYQEYLKSQGLCFLIEADSVAIEGRAMDLASLSGMAHDFFISSLERAGVSHDSQVFLQALVLADKSELPRDVRQAFTDCGTGHVLAVSGLHVGILSMAVIWLIGLFCGGRAAGVITLIVIWLYAFMVGLAPSIVRSSVMFSFLSLEKVIGRRMPSFHSLWAALFVILLTDPASVTSAGLWLSFAAVGGILAVSPVISPYIERQSPPIRWLCSSLTISVIAQIATLPILLFVFNSFPTYFWINNLVILEPIKWLFIGALLCPMLSWIPVIGSGLGWLIDKGLLAVIGYCEWASSLPFATIGCTAFGVAELVSLTITIVIAFYALRKRNRRWMCALGATAIGLICVFIVGEIRRESAIVLFCSNGETGVVFSEDRRNSMSYISDTTSHSALNAVRHIEKEMRWTEREIKAMGNGVIIKWNNKRMAIINTEDVDLLPKADVYLINSNIGPQKIDDYDARYIIGPNCEISATWQRLSSQGLDVTILKRQDEVVIK